MTKIKAAKQHYFLFIFWLWVIPQSIKLTSLYSLYNTPIDYINTISDYSVLLLALLYIFLYQKYSKSDFAKIVVIGILSIISAFRCHNFSLVSLFIIVVAAGDINIEKILKKYFHFGVFFVLITILLSFVGFIPDEVIIRYRDVRHSMGFRHPNILGIEVAQFVIIYMYLHRTNKFLKTVVLSVLSIIFLYFVPNSRTAYLLIGVIFFLFMIIQILERKKKSTRHLFIALFILAIVFNVFSIYFGITNGRSFLQNILGLPEQYTTALARITGGYDAYRIYGVHLFGTEVILDIQESWGIGHIWLDNTYLTLLIRYGIIMYIVFSFSYYYLMHIKKESNVYLFIILFGYCVYGVLEPSMFIFVYNDFLLFYKDILFKKNNEVREKIKHYR